MKSKISVKKILNNKYVFWFPLQNLSEIFIFLRRIERDTIKEVYWSSLKVTFRLFDSNETLIFSTDFSKILKYQISWKSVQCDLSCSVRTDRRAEITMLIVAFRNFAKAPNNSCSPSAFIFCVAEIRLCAADISFFFTVTVWWLNCDTEWLICMNVVPGWFLIWKSLLRI